MKEGFLDRLGQILKGGGAGNSRPTKETMLILFLSGILIFVILLPVDGEDAGYYGRRERESAVPDTRSDPAGSTAMDDTDMGSYVDGYKKGLEKELESFLSSVAGVGEVKVLIYMKGSQEYIVEKDHPFTNSVKGGDSDLTKDESTVYTVNGNGKEVPFITQTKSPAIDGVVVAAQGASDEAVRLQIVRLVMALYGIEANKVEVFAMEDAMGP